MLALGLVCSLSVTTAASDTPKTGLSPINRVNTEAPHYYDLTSVPRHQASFQKPIAEIAALESPASILPPSYFCEFIDYSGGNAAYYWTIPDPYGDDYFNMRFTSEYNFLCTLLTAYIGVYPAAFVGTPDMDVVIWDDDGFGYPLNELGRVNVPYSSLPPSIGYAQVDLSTVNGGDPLVFIDAEEFHVGVTTTDQVNNVLAILSDDGSTGQMRSSENWSGMWGLMLDDWGIDVNFLIGVDICCGEIPYSECYRQDYNCGVYYYWNQPDGFGSDYFNMRMENEGGRDTIMAVGVALYEPATVGTPDLDVFVWGSFAGYPDLSDIIFQTTIPNAGIVYFPEYNHVDMSWFRITTMDDFHVGWSTNELSDPAGILGGLSDDGLCGVGRSSYCFENLGCLWMDTYTGFGMDVNFLIYANICKDEGYCFEESFDCNLAYFWRLPDSYGDIGDYQKFPIRQSHNDCRVEFVRIALYDNGDPDIYTHNSEVQLWSTDPITGLPQTKLAGIVLTPADYVLYPGWTEVDFFDQNVFYNDDIWVGIESFAPTPETGIRTLSDDGSCGSLLSAENWSGTFYYMLDDWGVDVNFVYEVELCCNYDPPPYCGYPEDWPTSGKDFRRSAASNNSTGDARCKQALAWMHNDPAGFIYGRPIIYDGMVLAPYNDKLQAFDLSDGTLLWTATGLPEMGASFRNSVTCKDGFVYYGGGNGRSFTKADVYTGITVWSRNVLNNPFAGNTTYTTSVILDCDGTEVIFLGTAAGELYALDVGTGANYSGWAVNPVMLDGDILHTLSSNGDGVIYVATDGIYGTYTGTIYSIDACTGIINWSMGDGDLAGYDLDGDDTHSITKEIFQGPIGVDYDGSLYVQSAFEAEVDGTPSGAIYKIGHDGFIIWASPFQFSRFTGPVIDNNLVYMTGLRGWTSEGTNATFGIKKTNGATYWEVDEAYDARNWVEGALSCEYLYQDLLYMGNMDAQFLAINANDGSVEFEYNYDDVVSNRGVGVAIDSSGAVVFTNRQGDLYVFTEQVSRPRLRILKWDELQAVPFFAPNGYLVTFDDVFMNNGCANLTGSLSADAISPTASAWTVNPERIARMQRAADQMLDVKYSDMAKNLVKGQRVDPSTLDAEFAESPYAKDSYSNVGSYGPPAWLNGIVISSFTLLPKETFSVQYNVNSPLISRGPQRCYVTIFSSNDQYYLNSIGYPVVQLGVLGGCLENWDILPFGIGAANEAPVANTGEIGNQDQTLFQFDGDDAAYWQGGLFFAADQYRLAWNTESWHGGDPVDFWNSLLPDPNCFDQCEPYVTADPVLLGAMSNDNGLSYDPIYGYASKAAYIDSVIDFDCYGTGWDWSQIECPFDNALTMGIRVEESMYGVIDVPALSNVVIYKLEVANRNVDPIEIYVGAFNDFDLEANGWDVWKFSADYSIAYGASCYGTDFTNTKVYGMGKIPMDVDPMIGTRTLDAQQAMWHADNIALDSMYYWMTSEPGATYQVGIDPNFPCDPASESDDRDAWHSFVGHNFAGDETYTFGVYLFGGFGDITDEAAYQDLAVIVNQFCGFNRGDINDDGEKNLADVIALWNMVNSGGPGPLFQHLADVDASGGDPNNADVQYLANYYFCVPGAQAPVGDWVLLDICPQ